MPAMQQLYEIERAAFENGWKLDDLLVEAPSDWIHRVRYDLKQDAWYTRVDGRNQVTCRVPMVDITLRHSGACEGKYNAQGLTVKRPRVCVSVRGDCLMELYLG